MARTATVKSANTPSFCEELPASKRRSRKSVGRLVFTQRGQEYVAGTCPDCGHEVTLTPTEAEHFTSRFARVRSSLWTRLITSLYRRYVLPN